MAKTTFTLFRTRGGRVLVTTDRTLTVSDLDMLTRQLDAWARGPEGAVLLIPDCTYAGVVDEQAGVSLSATSVREIAEAATGDPAAGAANSADVDAEPVLQPDTPGFSADAMAGLLGDRAMTPAEVVSETGWDAAGVLMALRSDSRFEEVGAGDRRWQLTDEAAAALGSSAHV